MCISGEGCEIVLDFSCVSQPCRPTFIVELADGKVFRLHDCWAIQEPVWVERGKNTQHGQTDTMNSESNEFGSAYLCSRLVWVKPPRPARQQGGVEQADPSFIQCKHVSAATSIDSPDDVGM